MQRNSTKTGVERSAKPARTRKAAPKASADAVSDRKLSAKAPKKPAAPPAPEAIESRQAASTAPTGSERALDEAREGGPRYGGGAWDVADERGERRYGHARNDDGDPAQLIARDAERATGELPITDDAELDDAAGEIEGSGQRAGMGRGEKPRKTKSEEK